jgi:hypothetical protein
MMLGMAVWRLCETMKHGHESECQREAKPTKQPTKKTPSNRAHRIIVHCGVSEL